MSSNRAPSRIKPVRSKTRGDKRESSEVGEKIEVPQLAWKILNENTTKQLKDISNVDEVAKKLSEILLLEQCNISLKEAAQLDYFVAGYWFASRDSGFSDEQTSAFFTILHVLLDNIKTKGTSMVENIKELQSMISGVGCKGAPTCLECFTPDICFGVFLYMKSTLFQHYHLFTYLFTEEQQEEVINTDLTIEVPCNDSTKLPFPFPLEESIPINLYEKCHTSKPHPQPSEEDIVESKHEINLMDVEKIDTIGEELLEMSVDEIKATVESLTGPTLQSFQSQITRAMKEKEEEMCSRLSEVEVNLNSIL